MGSLNFGAIYRSKEFVIIAPESVISVITVKSNMNKDDIIDGLKNLSTLTRLDIYYRLDRLGIDMKPLFKPIKKFFVSYNGSSKNQNTLKIISNFYKDYLLKNKDINIYNPSDKPESIFPVTITSIESKDKSFIFGWGPPNDKLGTGIYKEDMKRIPFYYRQNNNITSQFEKLIFLILSSVYNYFGTKAVTILSGWADLNPIIGAMIRWRFRI